MKWIKNLIGNSVGELKDTERVLRMRFKIQTLEINLIVIILR
jgi:hypothetical protein